MTTRERMLWEETVRVLGQNSVTAAVPVEPPRARRVPAKARKASSLQEEDLRKL